MWFVFPFTELTLILKKELGGKRWNMVVGKWVFLGWTLAQVCSGNIEMLLKF